MSKIFIINKLQSNTMKRLSALWSLLFCVAALVGCGGDNGEVDQPTPPPSEKPVLDLKEVETTFNSVTVEISSNVPAEYGLCIVREGYDAPHIDEWFLQNHGDVDGKKSVTLENLEDNTTYLVYAALRSKADGALSVPKSIKITTPDDGVTNPITVLNTTQTSITFNINLEGYYAFVVVTEAEAVKYGGLEKYLTQFAYRGQGPFTYEWIEGASYEGKEITLTPDMEYHILAASCDSVKNISGEIFSATCRTLPIPKADVNVTTEFSELTPTSVKIKTTPDANVSRYYIYVATTEWTEQIIAGYGETMLADLIVRHHSNMGIEPYTQTNEMLCSDLKASTDYFCLVLAMDNKDAQVLFKNKFTTLNPTEGAPVVEATITAPEQNSHNSLNINIKSELAAHVKYVFRPTADINTKRANNEDDTFIVNNYGTELSAEDVAKVASTGLTMPQTELWYNTEYTLIVSVKSREYVETVTTVKFNTSKRPVPARVESNLFTSLLGDWEVSYTYLDGYGDTATISGKIVTIAQGVDATSEQDYREQNQLVILGWPFQQDDFIEGGTYFTPEELMAANSYWKDFPSLVYRDYGPKIFLQIGEGDVITIPTSREGYLYNDVPNGLTGAVPMEQTIQLNFFGGNYEYLSSAPATFPVTLTDKDTLVIKAYNDTTGEFGGITYRPAVLRNGTELRCVADSDIVLKRVK